MASDRPSRQRFLWVVEIWWEMRNSSEWLFEDAFPRKAAAMKHAKIMRKSGYKFRVVKYVSAKT